MIEIVLTLSARDLRGIDSNSLLRMYDQANAFVNQSEFQQEGAKAAKAVDRIAKELRHRKIPL